MVTVLKSRVIYGFCYSYLYKKFITVYFLMQILFHFLNKFNILTNKRFCGTRKSTLKTIEFKCNPGLGEQAEGPLVVRKFDRKEVEKEKQISHFGRIQILNIAISY